MNEELINRLLDILNKDKQIIKIINNKIEVNGKEIKINIPSNTKTKSINNFR